MKERSFDEMIAYFNRRVAEMDIAQDYKMELLGMVTALGYKHEKTAQQWIPCSERLPVEGESVLLCDRYGDMTLGRLVRTDEGCKWDIHAWWNDIDDWNAWMPLPEIWGGEEDG